MECSLWSGLSPGRKENVRGNARTVGFASFRLHCARHAAAGRVASVAAGGGGGHGAVRPSRGVST